MSIENLRVTESIGEDDPRFADLVADAEQFDLQRHSGKWSVSGSGESVTFADRDEEIAWISRNLRIGDHVDIDRGFPTYGTITAITEDGVRIAGGGNAWTLDRQYVADHLRSWRPKRARPADE